MARSGGTVPTQRGAGAFRHRRAVFIGSSRSKGENTVKAAPELDSHRAVPAADSLAEPPMDASEPPSHVRS
jgi:hypothetical protein